MEGDDQGEPVALLGVGVRNGLQLMDGVVDVVVMGKG